MLRSRLSTVLLVAMISSAVGLRGPAFIGSRPSLSAPLRAHMSVKMSSSEGDNKGSSLLRTLKTNPIQTPYHALSLVLLQKQKISQEGSFLHTFTTRPAQAPYHALSLALVQKAAVVATLKKGIDSLIKAAFHLYSIAVLQLHRLPRPKPIEAAFHAYSLALLRLQAAQENSARLRDSVDRRVARTKSNLEEATSTLLRKEKNEKMA